MATITFESNGRLEKTAVYINGEQVGGIKEVLLNLDEDGTFDSVIQYEGTDKVIYTKNIFTEQLENMRFVEPSFTEDEAENLRRITVESNGEIESTSVFGNEGEMLDGIVGIFLHIKAGTGPRGGIRALFGKNDNNGSGPEFKAQITFRNEDDSIDMEDIF